MSIEPFSEVVSRGKLAVRERLTDWLTHSDENFGMTIMPDSSLSGKQSLIQITKHSTHSIM